VELGPRVGRGRTADVFAYGDGRVVKVFHARVPQATVEREASVSRTLSGLHVPAPRFDGVVQVDGRDALVFERVMGPSMLSVVAKAPWRVVLLARLLADVHWQIHARPGAGLPLQHDYISSRIRASSGLPEALRAAALARLAELAEGDRVCHGDSHPDNVVLTPRGPVVIDWLTAVQGEPATDVARTRLLLEHASVPSGAGLAVAMFARVLRRLFARLYWRDYARRSGLRKSDVDFWRLPLITARFSENPPEDERRRLQRLLS